MLSVSVVFYLVFISIYKLKHECRTYTGNLASLEMKSISTRGIGYKDTLLKKREIIFRRGAGFEGFYLSYCALSNFPQSKCGTD